MIQIDIAAVHPRMGSSRLPWPTRHSPQAAGWDCHAALDEPLEVWPGRLVKVPLGFALALPGGWEAQVRPRSGLASQGLIMPNSPGTVDADYRGEVSALFFLLERAWPTGAPETDQQDGSIFINPGDRICQLVIAPVPEVAWNIVPRASLSPTARGEGGFGSTGVAQ